MMKPLCGSITNMDTMEPVTSILLPNIWQFLWATCLWHSLDNVHPSTLCAAPAQATKGYPEKLSPQKGAWPAEALYTPSHSLLGSLRRQVSLWHKAIALPPYQKWLLAAVGSNGLQLVPAPGSILSPSIWSLAGSSSS